MTACVATHTQRAKASSRAKTEVCNAPKRERFSTTMVLFSRSENSTQFLDINTLQDDIQKTTKMPHQPSVRFIEDLTGKETEHLAQLLTLGWRNTPSLQWLSEQENAVSHLPSSLRKPGILGQFAMTLPKSPQKAVLCPAHKGLNPLLIHRFFFQLSAECTTRLTRLEENPQPPPNVDAFLKRIHRINSLWFSPFIYRQLFKLSEKEECHEIIKGGCEACILSVVGADMKMLCDLRASMLGRRKKSHPRPRLLRIVDAWIDETGHGLDIRKDSTELGKEIRECRRQMQNARRQTRRNVKDGNVDKGRDEDQQLLPNESHEEEATPEDAFELDGKEKDANAEGYFESSILDYYTGNLDSNMNPASRTRVPTLVPEDSCHPAFRDSMMTFDENTGTFSLRDTSTSAPVPPESSARGTWSTWTTDITSSHRPSRGPPPPPTAPTEYTSSVYNHSQFGKPSFAPSSNDADVPSIPSTEAQRRAYNKMMENEEDDDEDENIERRRRDSKLSSFRLSRWMNSDDP